MLTVLLLACALALADDGPDAEADDDVPAGEQAAAITPPALIDQPAAAYPPEAQAAGVEAVVLLELGVDEAGFVIDAAVVEPVGQGFDESALLAARGARFEPARLGTGEPVSVRIRYNVTFTLDAVPVVSLEGRVREAGVRTPLADLELVATGPDGALALARTDAKGRYSFVGLAPGSWTVAVDGPALRAVTETFDVSADTVVSLDFFLVRDAQQDALTVDEEIVVEGVRVTPDLTERRLSAAEVKVLPGSNGDVVKVVQNLPGVARAPLGVGQLIIRGTAPEDSRFFIDGSPIPLVFHFAGLTAVVNSDFIEEVAFLPGNFSVRYGRIVGGLVDIRTDTELPERSGGSVSVDLYQSAVYLEQKLSDRTALSVSARRSYIDAVLSPVLSSGTVTVQAPRYYDAQARLLHKGPHGGTWDALFFLSDDRFRFLGVEGDEDELLASYADRFQRLRLRHLQPLGGGWQEETTIALGPERRAFEFGGSSEAYEERWTVSLREELVLPLSAERRLGGRMGLDLLAGRDALLFDEARFTEREEASSAFVAPGLYGEVRARLGRLTLLPGLRADSLAYADGYSRSSLDPRLVGRYVLSDTTVFKAGVGRFSAFPSLRQVAASSDGNPDLTAPWSLQSSVGVEQQLSGRLRADATAFYNRLFDRVVGREDRVRFFTGPPAAGPFDTDPYANDGVGSIYGVEALVRYDSPTAVGLLSATVSRSERQDRDDEPVELFEYDQPLVLNALWSQQLPRNWRLGGRVRFSSGNPYTPVVNRYQDMGSRTFVPVYGERSSARLPPFTSLDVRLDKTYTFKRWRLVTYLDVQNVTFAQNIEVIAWNWDYSEEDPITSNPPLPVFGFKGEW